MPWTPLQMKSIQARAHGWKGPGAFENISQQKAEEMSHEGLKKKMMVEIIRKRKK